MSKPLPQRSYRRKRVRPRKPPYVSHRLFTAYRGMMDLLGLPEFIRREELPVQTYGKKASLHTALQAMGYIDVEDRPTDLMRSWLSPQPNHTDSAILTGLQNAYPYLFEDDVDLAKITQEELSEKISQESEVFGSTLAKTVAFFILTAKSVGLPLRHDILKRNYTEAPMKPTNEPKPASAPSDDILRQLIAGFPKFDPSWDAERQKQWFETVQGFQRLALRNENGDQ